jgi:hypothetical protein
MLSIDYYSKMKIMTRYFIWLLFLFLFINGNAQNNKGKTIEANGIKLPAIWPPRNGNNEVRKSMDIPYLKNIPSVIPIKIGRQLFVDDF